MGDTIAIFDCGAQYTKVIDRRVRELNVATDIFPVETPLDALDVAKYAGFVLSGGPNSVYEAGSPQCDPAIFTLGKPVLGICYGMQLMTHHCGGHVASLGTKEYGETTIQVQTDSPLFQGLDTEQVVLMSHGDSVDRLPEGFKQIAHSHDGVVAAIADEGKKLYGVQFHPEVDLTEHGQAMLKQFVLGICQAPSSFVLKDRLDTAIQTIQNQVGEHPVFVLVSGGVDSTVTAALLLKALGPERVYAVHVDSGLMRHEESDAVIAALKALGLKHLDYAKSRDAFLNGFSGSNGSRFGPLSQLTDPEQKRQVIGDVFFHVVQDAIERLLPEDLRHNVFIAQGTLRPDLIESGNRDISTTAHTIKTHHNDVALIREQRDKGMIVEPNRDWHKDEVRQVGRLLGLSDELVDRQPFPGPGLGIRILCATQPYWPEGSNEIQTGLQQQVAPCQAQLLPVRSVGVQGDGRSYRQVLALAGDDVATLADWARRIPNQSAAINRVIWVINRQTLPPVHITPTTLTDDAIDQCRAVDQLVTTAFRQAGLLPKVSQLLTVLLPCGETPGQRSVTIRGVVTSDYMTARPMRLDQELSVALLRQLADTITQQQPGIDWVCWDMTGKPPATIEWE